ncbi:CRISPR-associated helicase Cas3' [Streptomyces smyrnaeus]|uniref:CRISPR-associated helicase Cas3' n=1 Tax=Streptomyces smyrnaeus TaxID=1387713 RepID=UPI00368F7F3D
MSGRVGRGDRSPWGKALERRGVVYPLLFHLLDSAAIADGLWDRFLSSNQRVWIARGLGVPQGVARGLVAFWAGLHDLGKLTPGFQQCAPGAYRAVSRALRGDAGDVERVGHARASMFTAFGPLVELGYGDDELDGAAAGVAGILGGHHGRFQQADPLFLSSADCVAGLGGASWDRLRREYVALVHEQVGGPRAPQQVPAAVGVLVTGLVILADWLASQEDYWLAKDVSEKATAGLHFREAVRSAGEVIEQAGLAREDLERLPFAELHQVQEPNPLQHSVMAELPAAVQGAGILVVTAAPGDGKTETALEAERVLSQAAGTRGVCFVLPTMATSDEMYKRVATAVARQSPEGALAVTLTHSMAWLNEAYGDAELAPGSRVVSHEELEDVPAAAEWERARPGAWLRGSKRALLAQYAVGTFDQALLSVLPVRHNSLRLLGLTGKTFVVDEAHAYEPYERELLQRLLSWLGRFGCPVVLLSATLPSTAGDQLVRAYLRGAGWKKRQLKGRSFQSAYPGWLFVDAQTAEATPMSPRRQEQHQEHRAARLSVCVEPVSHRLPQDAGRLAAVGRELAPLVEGQGSAAVVCSTVADAQATYLHLRDRADLQPGDELVLLHAQLPGEVREARARQITSRLGRKGRAPGRTVVVATQVIEQSLDLDVDLLISDLAPLSQLLQRAGRCWRHEDFWQRSGCPDHYRIRPAWAEGPRLVVLNPLDGEQEPPKHWGSVYPAYLLSATVEALEEQPDGVIDIPGEVQRLVERVHVKVPAGAEEQRYEQYLRLQGDLMAQEHVGRCAAVPGPRALQGLHEMHRETLDEVQAATRLGADSVRVLCCFRQENERITLDRAGQQPLPDHGKGGRLAPADVRTVMRRTIPVRASYLAQRGDQQSPPQAWEEQPLLSDLVLLVNEEPGAVDAAVHVGPVRFRLDDELGLIRQ